MTTRRGLTASRRLSGSVCVLCVLLGLAGCNFPGASETATPSEDGYGTSVQSLRGGSGSGVGSATYLPCPRHGETDFYQLCFEHQISMVLADDVGWSMTPNSGSNCTILMVSDTDTGQLGGDRAISFRLWGKWNLGNFNCDLDGNVTMTAHVAGLSACREGTLRLAVYEYWDPAPMTLECHSTREGGDDHPVPVEATIPTLEDQDFDLQFMLLPQGTVEVRSSNSPPFQAQFLYRLQPAPDPDAVPEVPLEPLVQ